MIRVAAPPPKPVMVFDADCNFCRRWIARWRKATGERIEYLPLQSPRIAEQFPEVPREKFERAVFLIEPDGSVFTGAAAVFRTRGRWWLYRLPGVGPVSEAAYRLVARNRRRCSRG
jgi:predicted DCC family thiol-disulfide oxidoreductase YuxK